MGNRKDRNNRKKSKGKLTAKQKAALEEGKHAALASRKSSGGGEKSFLETRVAELETKLEMERQEKRVYKKKYQSESRKSRRYRTEITKLRVNNKELRQKLQQEQKQREFYEKQCAIVGKEFKLAKAEILELVAQGKRQKYLFTDDRKVLRAKIYSLEKRVVRSEQIIKRLSLRVKNTPNFLFQCIRNGHMYSKKVRELAREMVDSGCSRAKVGRLIQRIGRTFGMEIKRTMSRRTVSRAIGEGGVAAKLQLAYEITKTPGLTLSADSTGIRKQNYEARHIAMRTPDYASQNLDINLSMLPRVRLLCMDATLDHSSATSLQGWKDGVAELAELFNRSPLAARLNKKFTAQHFLRTLKGMNGDHANNEKCAARGMKDWKRDERFKELGEDRLLGKEIGELILYLALWNAKKISDAGGKDGWEALSPLQQSERDAAMMVEVLKDLGQQEYDELGDDERREIDLFIWAGCCMHKDQNSFKGGNAEMMAEWFKFPDELAVAAPVLLANKDNAAILHSVLEKGSVPHGRLTDDQKRAFENSTRGGVKATALAGALFNHADDKRGEGDKHTNFMQSRLGDQHRRFPDTNNTRFGSHGLAAAELVKHLSFYTEYVNTQIPYSKNNHGHTNLEKNISDALKDPATVTELCAMVIYSNIISHPYMQVVRGPGTEETNILDLGPLHTKVQSHIRDILANPELVFGVNASYETSSLDGQLWEDEDAMNAVFSMQEHLPHLREITLAFFRGALPTWTRFSSEFAPGGLIDECSSDERRLAWMPSTNDANEGRLGHYRDEDYTFIMREARRVDGMGLEKKRREAQAAFRARLVAANVAKMEAKKKKAAELREKLKNIPLIRGLEDLDLPPTRAIDPTGQAKKWIGKLLDDQLDALRFPGVLLPLKKDTKKVAQKEETLRKVFLAYLEKLHELGKLFGSSLDGQDDDGDSLPLIEDWEAAEDREMDVD